MEYKAISQASYKFTSTRETTIQGADVLNSGFRFGTIKTTNNMVFQLLPSYGIKSYTTKGMNFTWRILNNDADTYAYCNGYLYPVTVDGKTYYGTKCCRFCLGNPSSLEAYGPVNITLKVGTLKVLRYDNSIQTIVVDEYITDDKSSGSSSGSGSYSYLYLEVYKQTDDVILAVWWEETTTTTSE